jgi:hypothetical protein
MAKAGEEGVVTVRPDKVFIVISIALKESPNLRGRLAANN